MGGGRESWIPKLPKMCVFRLKNDFFFEKIDKESPKCTEGGAGKVTGLGLRPEICPLFFLLPFPKIQNINQT